MERLHTLSNSIECVNTLGYGKNGNIVLDKNSAERKLKPTSTTVGYVFKNIGNTAIQYKTELFHDDGTGKFVGEVVEKTWNPGETIMLSRKYTTIMCAIPEISFTLANGKIVASSKKISKTGGIDEELSAYYFAFNKDENGNALQVNDDEVKLAIDTADGIIKDEYIETFGFLKNPKSVKLPRQNGGSSFTTQDLAANYFNRLCNMN
jgi:hypothetical protein